MSKRRIESALLSIQGISHGFFTRNGGVSNGIYGSLNCGYGSNDETDNVSQNRSIVAGFLGVETAPVLTPYQHHSADVVFVDQSWLPSNPPKADAIVTNVDNLILGVLTADCAPVLFVDPKTRMIGAAHAGWRGAADGILENTVEFMVQHGAKRQSIVASIGPCLGQNNFEVGPEFFDQFTANHAQNDRYFEMNSLSGKHHFNLKAYTADKLLKTGISDVHTHPHCTYESESLFFSYRRNTHRSEADYGRQISAIVIN